MSRSFDKLVALLKELFQLDRPDLDFGFYRIMHAKSAEVTQFLEKDLLPQVQAALSKYQSADKAAIEKQLDETVRRIRSDGADPDTSPKVRDLRTRLAEEAVDLDALEAEVYDHLYAFFRRYYSEGDFLSKRVYKPGVYAIPYEGEEVKLHWANADQYYIKTSEYLRDYAFRLRPDDAEDPMRVHLRLVDAAEGEHGNVKAAESGKRVFLLRETDFIAEEDGEQGKERKELVIRFEYRPATLADWPEGGEEGKGKNKPPAQKDLIALAEQRVREAEEPGLARWIEALERPHVTADGEQADCSCLRVHLNRYTARNTFDYFIHKDLDGFLRRELDFYIKNEVMHLDDVENETALRVEQYLSNSSFGIQNDGKSLHHRYHSNSSRMVNTSNWRLRAKKIFTLSSNAVMRVSAQHPKASPSSSSVSEIIARNRCHSRPAKLNAFNRSCISARTSPMRALSHSNFA